MEDRILKLLINRVAGFVVFLLVLILLNIFITYISMPIVRDIVLFFNNSVLTLGIILLLMVLGEIFMMVDFPLNLPGPLFNAAGSVFIIYFILDIFKLLMTLGAISLPIPFNLIFMVIAIVVCLVVLITGYVSIFRNIPKKIKRGVKREEEEDEEDEEPEEDEEEESEEESEKDEEKVKKEKKEEKPVKKPIIKKKVKKVKIR